MLSRQVKSWGKGLRGLAVIALTVIFSVIDIAFAAEEKTGRLDVPQSGSGTTPGAEPVFTWGGYFQAIGWMVALLVALWGVLWLIRRYGKFNSIPMPGAFPRSGLRMEAQLSIAPKKGLVVVRYLNKRLLLGLTEKQITLLQESEVEENQNEINGAPDSEQEPVRPGSGRENKDLRSDAQLFANIMHAAQTSPGNDKS